MSETESQREKIESTLDGDVAKTMHELAASV